jgi:hypothetical protein
MFARAYEILAKKFHPDSARTHVQFTIDTTSASIFTTEVMFSNGRFEEPSWFERLFSTQRLHSEMRIPYRVYSTRKKYFNQAFTYDLCFSANHRRSEQPTFDSLRKGFGNGQIAPYWFNCLQDRCTVLSDEDVIGIARQALGLDSTVTCFFADVIPEEHRYYSRRPDVWMLLFLLGTAQYPNPNNPDSTFAPKTKSLPVQLEVRIDGNTGEFVSVIGPLEVDNDVSFALNDDKYLRLQQRVDSIRSVLRERQLKALEKAGKK